MSWVPEDILNGRPDYENVVDDMVAPWGTRSHGPDIERIRMSDNQSENAADWQPGETRKLPELALAEAEALAAEQRIYECEEMLEEAKRLAKLAKGRLYIVKDKPTWKRIFSPGTIMSPDQVYAYCKQTGYDYACWNSKIYKVGGPSEQLIDTGVWEEDIK